MSTEAMSPDEVREISVFFLAAKDLADCGTPDSTTSAGAEFLASVRRDTLDLLERVLADQPDIDADGINDNGSVHQIADDAPAIYTARKWAQFVDLAAWQEDVSDLAGDTGDMDQLGSVALYIIAERLAWAIIRSVCAWHVEQRTEADEDDVRGADCDHSDSRVCQGLGHWREGQDG